MVYAFRVAPPAYRLASSIDDTKSTIMIITQAILGIFTRLLNFYWTVLIIRKFFEVKQSKERTS